MDPFPPLYDVFLFAAGARLREESFLDQARRHIKTGKLRVSGLRFSVQFDRHGKPIVRVGLPSDEPPDRVEIPPLAMADHRLIFVKVDCQAVLGVAVPYSRMSGWKDVRGVADDVEQLWPRVATSDADIKAAILAKEKSIGRQLTGPEAWGAVKEKFPEVTRARARAIWKALYPVRKPGPR